MTTNRFLACIRRTFIPVSFLLVSHSALAQSDLVLTNLITNSVSFKDNDSQDFVGPIIKFCESQDKCVFGTFSPGPDDDENAKNLQGSVLTLFTSKAKPVALNDAEIKVNQVDPKTMDQMERDWKKIQKSCSIITKVACTVATVYNKPLGIGCVFATDFLCSLNPGDIGIKDCDFYTPNPGPLKSIKLTPASAGAQKSKKCREIAAKTIAPNNVNAAVSSCMIAVGTGMDLDSCSIRPDACYYQTMVNQDPGTTVPDNCRNIIR